MLAEGFLTSLPYREEKTFASKQKRGQTGAHRVDPLSYAVSYSRSALPQMLSAEEGNTVTVLKCSVKGQLELLKITMELN